MWGIVPAAGRGSRIQPLAFSKELLPVGSRLDGGIERPCAVSEYLLERMLRGGADKICIVISPGKSDIMEYYGGGYGEAAIASVVQPQDRKSVGEGKRGDIGVTGVQTCALPISSRRSCCPWAAGLTAESSGPAPSASICWSACSAAEPTRSAS